MKKMGKCALCKRNNQDLRNSHFLPAGVYRVIRDETRSNPDPLKFTDIGVIRDSKQVSDYLLCGDCEQRLSRKGENWFLRHCWKKNQFRLSALLESASPEAVYSQLKVYHAWWYLGCIQGQRVWQKLQDKNHKEGGCVWNIGKTEKSRLGG